MGNKQPFRKSPLSQTYQPNKGRAQNTRLLLTKSGAQQTGRRGQQSGYRSQFQGHQRGKNVYNDKQDKQHFLEVSPRFQNGESTSSGENTVSNIFSSSGSTCRKAKSILFKLDKTNTRSKYFKHNTGLRDTFSRETLPNKIAKPSSPEPRTVKHCRGGSQGNVVKRDNTESNTVQKSVHKQSLSDIKKGWGQSLGNKFEISEQFHPQLTFQNGGTQFTSKHATGKGFHVQIRPKRRLLLCATKKGKQEICAFPVGSVPSLCLCFGLGPAPLIFTKILKIPISSLRRLQIRVIIYLDDMILMSQTIELLISMDTVIFLLTHLGFVINPKKSMLNPVQKIEFLGLETDSVAMK